MNDSAIFKLLFQVTGQEELKAMRDAHADLKAKILDATSAYKTLDDAVKDPAISKATADLKALETEANNLEKALKKAGQSGFNSGNAMIQWSRALQDFQAAGFAGIANNMELMASSIGAPAFIAGLATIAGTFGPVLVRSVADFVSSLMPVKDVIASAAGEAEKLKERIKELEKHPIQFAVDQAELDRTQAKLKQLEESAKAARAAMTGRSNIEIESGKAVKDVFAELAPGEQPALMASMRSQVVREMESHDAAIAKPQEIEQQIKKLKDDIWHLRVLPTETNKLRLLTLENEKREAEQAAQNRRYAIGREGGEADSFLGEEWKAATGQESTIDIASGNERIAARLRQAGRADLGLKVWERAPARIEEFKDDAERVKKFQEWSLSQHKQDQSKRRQRDSQDVAALAKDLEQSELADRFLDGEKITLEDVTAAIEPAVGPETAQRLAPEVYRHFIRAMALKVGHRSVQTGASIPEAMEDLSNETRLAKDADKARKKDEREIKKGDRQATSKAQKEANEYRKLKPAGAYAYDLARQFDGAGHDEAMIRAEMAQNEYDANVNQGKQDEMMGRGFARDKDLRTKISAALLGGTPSDQVGTALGKMMEQDGYVNKGGGQAVGQVAAREVRDDLNKRILGLQTQGLTQQQAIAVLQRDFIAELIKQGQQLERVEQIIENNRQQMYQYRQTVQNRTRR